MNMMSKFKSTYPPDELLMQLFVQNIGLQAAVESLKVVAVEFYLKQGMTREQIEKVFAALGVKALNKIIVEHEYLTDEWKEELKKSLIK